MPSFSLRGPKNASSSCHSRVSLFRSRFASFFRRVIDSHPFFFFLPSTTFVRSSSPLLLSPPRPKTLSRPLILLQVQEELFTQKSSLNSNALSSFLEQASVRGRARASSQKVKFLAAAPLKKKKEKNFGSPKKKFL